MCGKAKTEQDMKHNYMILLIFFLIQNINLIGQSYSVNDFEETNPPKVFSSEWFPINHSKKEFNVSVENGELIIKDYIYTSKTEFQISGGKLVGINNGEWGGELFFLPSGPNEKRVDIKEGKINLIFELNGKIYFIENLTDYMSSRGALYQLDSKDGKFTYKKILDFEDSPQAFSIYKDEILIATYENFYVFKDFKKDIVFKDTFWSGLYPNSIAVVDKKIVYMGIRGGYVKLNLIDKKFIFYKYKK